MDQMKDGRDRHKNGNDLNNSFLPQFLKKFKDLESVSFKAGNIEKVAYWEWQATGAFSVPRVIGTNLNSVILLP
jgi:hypothetical protein